MPKVTLAGHPLHTQLNDAPMALLPFSLILDLLHRRTGKEAYAEAAYYGLMGTVIGGAAAGAVGAADYLTIPSGSEAKRTGTFHALLNLGLLGLVGGNLLLRRGKRPPTGRVPLLLSALGNLWLLVSSWYGSELVHVHGMRVARVDPAAGAPELKLPGDDQVAEAARAVAHAVTPTGGPQT